MDWGMERGTTSRCCGMGVSVAARLEGWKTMLWRVLGCFTDSDMSKKIYANIPMPSGISKPNQVKVVVNEGLDSIMVSVLTPSFLCDAFNLHKDTMANCENVAQSEINHACLR